MDIAIISGASSGIGYCIAKEIDKLFFDEIWLISSSEAKLNRVSQELNTKSRIFALDLSQNNSLDIVSNALDEEKPNIKYLICSAGVGYNGNFEDISCEQASKMIDINVRALTELTTRALPYIRKNGKIIEIASSAGFMPQPSFAVYSATKSYVISFSRAIAYELKAQGISVTAVCPGPVDTPFFSGLENVKEYKKKYAISPELVAKKAMKSSKKGKFLCVPTFSMKMVLLASKIIPISIIMKFYK
ncbi:MAG: SDR family NAD(P)-dependent oxidoreductase [Clostridia bacterium]|nr:SDR family NAD(P)-dependent oxidoreductase [Clostridia bacterium]